MQAGIVTVDLHGKNQYQAQITVDALLRRASRGTYRLRLIHGSSHGTALRDMIRSRYGHHPGVLRLDCTNPDITDLVLREF